MDIDALRRYCLEFPHTTENVQWGSDLCFKVDGKLFAVTNLEVGPVKLSFKCSPEDFAELCEREDVIPAPYMARAQWVALRSCISVPDDELRELLADSYRLVWERLPKRRREELAATAAGTSNRKPGKVSAAKKVAKSPRKSKSTAPGRRK